MPASQRPLKWSNRPFTLALRCGPRAHCGASAFRRGSFCFAFYRLPFEGRPRTKLVMLARTCGTSGACRAAVGAHTCTGTAACAHTASGASVDSGTTSGVHRVSAHSRCIILQIFHAACPTARTNPAPPSHRVFTSHFTLTPEWSHLVPAQGRDSRSHGCARHR
jgi:hypothetical protein